MLRIAKSLLIPLAVVLGTGASSTAPADAAAFAVEISHHAPRSGDEHWRRDRHDFARRHDDDRWFGRPWERPRAAACTPKRALFKARDLGLRGARIRHAGWKTITVSGWKWGQPVAVRFARAPLCPVLAW